MAQSQVKKTKQSKTTEVVEDEVQPSPLDLDIDSILADIDDVLEENAQDFVEAFVQKGGE